MKKAVFSLFYHIRSGTFEWWDDFPLRISELLGRNIDHFCFYKDYIGTSRHTQRFKVTFSDIKKYNFVKKNLFPLVEKYDQVIVHSHNWPVHTALWLFNHNFNRKTRWIMTDHDLWKPKEFSRVKRLVKSVIRSVGYYPEVFIGTSKASCNRLKSIYGKKNIIYIHNGIKIKGAIKPDRTNKKPTKALFVGRLVPEKGLWPLVEAIKRARQQEINIDLTVIGDGILYKPLKHFIEENKLQDMINLAGYVHKVEEEYKKHDFLIIPSLYNESFGLISVEAQSFYLPCIYTSSGGLPETQIDGKTGLMIAKDNPQAILNAIKILQSDSEKFYFMRLAARQNAIAFNLDKMAKRYIHLYSQIFGHWKDVNKTINLENETTRLA